jgi:hypothetical protein
MLHNAEAAWAEALGGMPVFLLPNVQQARGLLLRALGLARGKAFGVPANATRELVEAIKQANTTPSFLALDADLRLVWDEQYEPLAALWLQPYGGVGTVSTAASIPLIIDASDTVPTFISGSTTARATLFGLFLDHKSAHSGALLVCHDRDLAAIIAQLRTIDDGVDGGAALAQLARLSGPDGLVARQQAQLAIAQQGLAEAAGLPLVPTLPHVLAHHVGVRVPPPGDGPTFYAYVQGEHTPIQWLPAQRPLHYAALRTLATTELATTAAHLAHTLLVPIGPHDRDEEIVHGVLGVSKAADYLGLRWYTDPQRAMWYATLLQEWYGSDHDAYRPLFALPGV